MKYQPKTQYLYNTDRQYIHGESGGLMLNSSTMPYSFIAVAEKILRRKIIKVGLSRLCVRFVPTKTSGVTLLVLL